ncbi:pfyP, partial [Symbiodinium sp. KB8]
MLGQWGNDHSTDIQLQKTWMSKLIINAYLNRSMVGGMEDDDVVVQVPCPTRQASECLKTGWENQISVSSDASTTHSLEELSAPQFFTKQCSNIDVMTSRVVRESSIQQAICAAVADGQVSVTVADPRSEDAALIAISEQFESMTGYSRQEILGKNCRFLNVGCDCKPGDLLRLRRSVETGEPFTGVLENRRKSGELFRNLLDLCGLTVARNPFNGAELWFLVGIQADVSALDEISLHKAEQEVHRVANDIRSRLADQLSALAISGALMSNFEVSDEGNYLRSREYSKPRDLDPEVWSLLPTPQWKSGAIPSTPPAPVSDTALSGNARALLVRGKQECQEEVCTA